MSTILLIILVLSTGGSVARLAVQTEAGDITQVADSALVVVVLPCTASRRPAVSRFSSLS